jgi:hypothetical protein
MLRQDDRCPECGGQLALADAEDAPSAEDPDFESRAEGGRRNG